jgi:hypothetical protein
MSVYKLADAIRVAFPQGVPDGVHELWHVDTSAPAVLRFWDIQQLIRGNWH